MICKNCGKNNTEGVSYCAYCGKPLNMEDNLYNPQPTDKKDSSKNTIKIIAIIVSMFLVLGGGFLLFKDKIFSDDVSIEKINIEGDYEMDGETYVFTVNKTVVIDPEIKSSKDNIKLRYEIEDSGVASIMKLDNKCSIIGNNPKQTKLNIYNNDEFLESIKISFKNEETSSSKNDVNNVVNNTTNNNTVNNNTTNNYNGNRNNNNESSSNDDSNIPLEDLTYFMSCYLSNYQSAINYGNFSEISGSLTSNGKLYKDLKKSVPRTYDKGIIIQLRACNKVKARKVSSGVYSITYTVDWEIYNPNQDTYRLQREYGDYIIYKSGGTCKLDRLENWEILSKEYF